VRFADAARLDAISKAIDDDLKPGA